MSVFGKVFGWVRKEAVVAATALRRLVGDDTAQAVAKSVLALAKTEAFQVATVAVKYAETIRPGASNAEQRSAALSYLTTTLKQSGVDIEEGLANYLIEAAINTIKGRIIAKVE